MKILYIAFSVLILTLSIQAKERPNIVFLLADDMGYGDLACYGNPVVKSPNLDKIASEGVRLSACYSASPNCSPARTGILTGRNPYRVGMYDFARFKELHIPKDETTVAEIFKSAGYQTMFAGKWHCSGDFLNQPNPGDHGFSHWLAHPKNFGKDSTGFFRNGKAVPKVDGWMSQVVVNEAIEFIQNRDSEKPFFTMLWFSEPHTPVAAEEKFIDLYKNEASEMASKGLLFGGDKVERNKAREELKNTYFGCISMLDFHIGRLMKFLKEAKLEENTIVIFTSDNGPEHRVSTSFGSPGNLRGAKGHIHEGGYRVPGIVKWPGKITAASTLNEPVNGTDWLPTLAKFANVPVDIHKTLDGADATEALLKGDAITRKKPMFWWLYHARGGKEVSMRYGRYKILANMLPQKDININDAGPQPGQSIMDFIKTSSLGNFSLYNLESDPTESKDLSKEQPELLMKLKEMMISLHSEIRSEGPNYKNLGHKK